MTATDVPINPLSAGCGIVLHDVGKLRWVVPAAQIACPPRVREPQGERLQAVRLRPAEVLLERGQTVEARVVAQERHPVQQHAHLLLVAPRERAEALIEASAHDRAIGRLHDLQALGDGVEERVVVKGALEAVDRGVEVLGLLARPHRDERPGDLERTGFNLGLSVDCWGAACGFEHTASIGLVLPEGVSYTSDSGVFLTGVTAVAPVPEPETWALMLAGLGVVGRLARRRQTRA